MVPLRKQKKKEKKTCKGGDEKRSSTKMPDAKGWHQRKGPSGLPRKRKKSSTTLLEGGKSANNTIG